MKNENRLVPDFRAETVEEITETYTPEGGTEQTATYKIGTAHPIIGGILDKLAWVRTHVAAVWWNKLAGVTLKNKIDAMDESIAQLNSKNRYSFEESCIGTWIDGKPLYRKMIDFGALPSNATKTVSADVDNIAHAHVNIGESFWTYNEQNAILNEHSFSFAYIIYIEYVSYTKGNIVIRTNNAETSGYHAYVCLEYTKTID